MAEEMGVFETIHSMRAMRRLKPDPVPTEMIRKIYNMTDGKVPIIGVGGIFTADDAWEKIAAGASLIQLYTGLVFEGPAIAKNIVKGLKKRVADEGYECISDAVGINA